MTAQTAINDIEPKLKVKTDSATIGPTLAALTGNGIVADTTSASLTKVESVMRGCSTDVLIEQKPQAVRLLNELWLAIIGKLGVSEVANHLSLIHI